MGGAASQSPECHSSYEQHSEPSQTRRDEMSSGEEHRPTQQGDKKELSLSQETYLEFTRKSVLPSLKLLTAGSVISSRSPADIIVRTNASTPPT